MIGLATAAVVGRWIVRKWSHQNHEGKDAADASSTVDDYDPESGEHSTEESVVESTESHVESEPGDLVSIKDDIESGGAMRTSSNCSLHHEDGAQVCVCVWEGVRV